ncbi:MAG: LL-diaminopimelate aminotransferase [Jaaginema sp. PMC 1079.18]|nr:LL-diaminopimelate aminotransferase [Jaaginema sp. PMC 1080.18]MEC4853865.1 LL-diaminopimelate aminotransferase [Jaaginema sp. PMC 1079.18]MEC4868568.1 LL-diaminopimelate aminotransferase [Jaaginema sp. PMC 1078.18]
MQFAQRLNPLNRNVFADMDCAKAQARESGKEILDLSLGSSDLPVAQPILETIEKALGDRATYGYNLFASTRFFREAIAQWYENRYGIPLDPETEVLPLIGSQEGTAHFPLAVLNPGDIALLLDPGYPSHSGGVHLAGGQIYTLPLTAENNYLPVFQDIPPEVRTQAKMMVLSYPHNPTTATAPLSFFQEAVAFCRQHDIILVHDFPYHDFVFEGIPQPPSILQADTHKTITIEFFSFSKSYNMGGFRCGFAVGNAAIVGALKQVKAVVDFNQYLGIMRGATVALKCDRALVQQTLHRFQNRRDALIAALHDIGWSVPTPTATMYIWAQLPPAWRERSRQFATELVAATGVAVSPGAGFGKSGEGYIRFALVHDPDILQLAVQRMAAFL